VQIGPSPSSNSSPRSLTWILSRGRARARQTQSEGARWRLWGGAAAVQGPCEPVGARSTAKGDSLWLLVGDERGREKGTSGAVRGEEGGFTLG
jgi:hypothetical protein